MPKINRSARPDVENGRRKVPKVGSSFSYALFQTISHKIGRSDRPGGPFSKFRTVPRMRLQGASRQPTSSDFPDFFLSSPPYSLVRKFRGSCLRVWPARHYQHSFVRAEKGQRQTTTVKFPSGRSAATSEGMGTAAWARPRYIRLKPQKGERLEAGDRPSSVHLFFRAGRPRAPGT